MARKARKLDDGEIAQVEALAAYLSQEQIADYFGIGRTTWYAILALNVLCLTSNRQTVMTGNDQSKD